MVGDDDVGTVRHAAQLQADGPLSYRPKEAARLLDVSERTVRRLVASGQLRAVRHGPRLILIPRDALYDFLGLDTPDAPARASR